MKTIVKILFLCGIIVLTAFSCEKLKTNDYNPEGYVNILVGRNQNLKIIIL